MCCLAYEVDTYCELKKDLPKVGNGWSLRRPGEGQPAEYHQSDGESRLDDGKEVEVGLAKSGKNHS
jgi:hypothetical protein